MKNEYINKIVDEFIEWSKKAELYFSAMSKKKIVCFTFYNEYKLCPWKLFNEKDIKKEMVSSLKTDKKLAFKLMMSCNYFHDIFRNDAMEELKSYNLKKFIFKSEDLLDDELDEMSEIGFLNSEAFSDILKIDYMTDKQAQYLSAALYDLHKNFYNDRNYDDEQLANKFLNWVKKVDKFISNTNYNLDDEKINDRIVKIFDENLKNYLFGNFYNENFEDPKLLERLVSHMKTEKNKIADYMNICGRFEDYYIDNMIDILSDYNLKNSLFINDKIIIDEASSLTEEEIKNTDVFPLNIKSSFNILEEARELQDELNKLYRCMGKVKESER